MSSVRVHRAVVNRTPPQREVRIHHAEVIRTPEIPDRLIRIYDAWIAHGFEPPLTGGLTRVCWGGQWVTATRRVHYGGVWV